MKGHIYKIVRDDTRRMQLYTAVVLKGGESEPFTLLRRNKKRYLIVDMDYSLPEVRRVSGRLFDREVRRMKGSA